MKATTLKKAAALAGSVSLLAGSAFSQTAVSGAGGYTTESIIEGFNLLGVSLLEPVAVSGTIDSEADNVVTDADPGDLTTILDDPDATYLIEILSGAQAGAVAEITGITATELTLAGPLGAGTADYQVRAAPTLNDLFGADLQGGAALTPTVDVVWLPDGEGGFSTYGLNTTGNEFRPTDGFFLPVAKPVSVLYPDGLFIERKAGNGGADIVITGMVKTTDTVVSANEGFNLAAVNAPVGQTLGNSGLEGFLNGGAALTPTVDVVWLPDGSGGFDTYAYNTTGSVWRTTAGFFVGDESDTELTSGIFIERKAGNGDTAGAITVPAFYENL